MTLITTPNRSKLAEARALVDEWMTESVTGVVSRSLVIDRLLDLRALVSSNPTLLQDTNVALSNIPGVNLVDATWWLEALDGFDDSLRGVDDAER
jgi:hypothetical protein